MKSLSHVSGYPSKFSMFSVGCITLERAETTEFILLFTALCWFCNIFAFCLQWTKDKVCCFPFVIFIVKFFLSLFCHYLVVHITNKCVVNFLCSWKCQRSVSKRRINSQFNMPYSLRKIEDLTFHFKTISSCLVISSMIVLSGYHVALMF